MKRTLFVVVFATALASSCGNENRYAQYDMKSTDENAAASPKSEVYEEESPAEQYNGNASPSESKEMSALRLQLSKNGDDVQSIISSVAAVIDPNDTIRKFVRTADLRFRVKDARRSTYAIEDAVLRNGGYVEYTHLTNNIQRVNHTRISNDSTLESTYFVLENSMRLRVPAQRLDSTLRQIGREVDFLEYRNIDAEDIRFDLLAKQLQRKRLAKFNRRLSDAIDEKGKKLNDIEGAENALLNAEEQSDNAYIEKLRQLDKVEYATITLHLHQRESVRNEMLANDQNLKDYEPSFWSKLGESFKEGWNIVEILLLGLVKIWVFLIIGAIAYWYIRKKLKEFNKKPQA